ncbi:hypothetical protein J4E90_007840 [Alternaria incomplexa]|uniref:uncharacterized protein n=1 Tax=Alternaria incomplexa TaxID=1187928 RepID=UPI002221179A|nr:uncharacterized protein J4E90_007840 [Alternaria incomplexa]KAI4910405.1 hypothetical protein J4E90_007840 [Alternaria incomplexa]
MSITKIEQEANEIIAYKGDTPSSHPFLKLADDVFPDEATKHALLCFSSQFLPMAYMHPLLKKLLKKQKIDIHEVMVKIKAAPRTIVVLAEDGTESSKNWPVHGLVLLRITSQRNGKRWYTNLSGAEFGLTQAIFSAADFESKHVQALCAVFNFGRCRDYVQACSALAGCYSHTQRIGLRASSRMEKALLAFMQKPGNDLVSLRHSKDTTESASWHQSLAEALSKAVGEYISNYDASPLMYQITNESEETTRNTMAEHIDHASILGDAMTDEEKANRPNVALDLAQMMQQHGGPGANMVADVFKSLR